MKRLLSLLLCAALLAACVPAVMAEGTPSFSMEKTSFTQSETIAFNCQNVDSTLYICVLKAGYKNYTKQEDGGDRRAIVYCRTNRPTLAASSLAAGDYAAVLFGPNWVKYNEIAFSVTENTATPSFTMEKTSYKQGETIAFNCQNVDSTMYVCILKAGYKNYTKEEDGGDRRGLVYCRTNRPTLSASSLAVGDYAAVLFGEGWTKYTEIAFSVTENTSPHFTMNASSFLQSETISFNFYNTDSSMYICILPAGYTNFNTRYAIIYCGADSATCAASKMPAGNYAVVLFGPSWAKYDEKAITVSENPSAPSFTLAKTVYTKGDSITFSCVNVSSSYYVAILKEGYKNYTAAESGGDLIAKITCNTASPSYSTSSMAPGKYAAVLFGAGWTKQKELAFELSDPNDPKSFTLDKTSYEKGDTVHFTFHNAVSGDYVAIFPAPVSGYATRYGLYYLKAKETTHDYVIPDTLPTGNYAAILFDNVGNWAHLTTVEFSVKEKRPEKRVSVDTVIGVNTAFTATVQYAESGDTVAICPAGYTSVRTQAIETKPCTALSFSALSVGNYVAVLCENGDPDTVVATAPFAVKTCHNDGIAITAYADVTLDLAKEAHEEKQGQLFVGWTNEQHTAVSATPTLKKGEKLLASYVDFDLEVGGDFAVYGVQMRTAGVQGMRFIAEKSKSLVASLPHGMTEFGTLLLPSVALNDNENDRYAELLYGKTYKKGGKSYTPSAVVGEKLFAETNDRVLYTACLTSIPAASYQMQITARAYFTFTDHNGIAHTVYSQSYATNLYTVARTTMEVYHYDGTTGAALQAVIDTVTAAHDQTFNSNNKATVLGSASYKPTWVYKLNDTGLQVREVEINSGKGGDAVSVVQLADLHLSDTTSQSVINTVRQTMKYASTADMLVVDGDAIDALSDRCLNMLHREVWEVNPTAFVSLGNHDFVNKTGKDLTNAEIYSALQDGWKHDIYYASKVIGNKVMVIQLDDGATTFRDCQVEPLKADLKTAKEKGYTVLIFTHISLCTCNPNDTAVNSLDGTANPATYPFGTNSNNTFLGAPKMPAGATKDVYELIVNNADVVKGVFTGHAHKDFYTEILGKTSDGKDAVIPQYTLAKSSDGNGHALKITVK